MALLKAGNNKTVQYFRKHTLEARIRNVQECKQGTFWESDGGQRMGTQTGTVGKEDPK